MSYKFEKEILCLINTYIPIGYDIQKLKITSDVMSNTLIFVNNQKPIQMIDETKYEFSEIMIKILLNYEFIGKNSHIQNLDIILEVDKPPLINIKEIGLVI